MPLWVDMVAIRGRSVGRRGFSRGFFRFWSRPGIEVSAFSPRQSSPAPRERATSSTHPTARDPPARERTAPERDTMAKRKAAPPEEDSEEEEFVDEDLMGSEDDDDEEAAAGGGRDFDEEEDDDEELEAEMAALESVRKERGMDRGDKPRINNEAGLDASIQGTSHPLAADPPHQSQSRRRRR